MILCGDGGGKKPRGDQLRIANSVREVKRCGGENKSNLKFSIFHFFFKLIFTKVKWRLFLCKSTVITCLSRNGINPKDSFCILIVSNPQHF